MTDDLSRTPPNDGEAERGAIALTLTLGAIPEELQTLTPPDFYQPDHEALWHICQQLVDSKNRCDTDAVRAQLMATGQHRLLGLLVSLIGEGIGRDANTLAGIIADRAGLRRLIEVHVRGLQQAQQAAAEYEELVRRAETDLAAVPTSHTDDTDTLLTLDEFLGEQEPEPEWVVDGYLARGERLILTGVEGWGKSTMLRQLALCAAAGMDPFTGRQQPPRRVLMIDVENPKFIMQRKLTDLRQAIHAHGLTISPNNMLIDRHPQGLDMTHPADRRWLEKRVRLANPDLLVIGPAYKLHEAGNDDKDETIARLVTGVLDDLRAEHDFALLLEHHAGNETAGGHRPVRPFGSSLWRRWPEFGYGIRPVKPPKGWTAQDVERRKRVELVPWRGARDERPWPRFMESGGAAMPWVETELEAA